MAIKYTKEILENAINGCSTWAEVCLKLGVKPYTGAQYHIKNRATFYEIATLFPGQAWSRGRTDLKKKSLESYLKKNGSFITSHNLKKRLIRDGYKMAVCETDGCGLSSWLGEEIPLELDHKNNDHFDNRIENLAILCPTCHAIKTRRARSKK